MDILTEKCWPGYEKKGMKTMFGKRYPNCVKKKRKKKRKKKTNEQEDIFDMESILSDKDKVLDIIKDELRLFLEEEALEEKKKRKKRKKKKKKKAKRDACYHKVRARYDVWPSAYASGALVKCRKVGAANWGKSTTKEELELYDDLMLYEAEESLEAKIRQALIDEGGAAGMKALKDHTKASESEIKDAIKDMKDVGLHEDGDYILQDDKEIDVKKKLDEGAASESYCKSTPCDKMGFTQKASCKSQGFKDCYPSKNKNENLQEADPKKGTGKKPKGSGRRLYTDEDPSDTVSVKFSSAAAIQQTLAKDSFKSKSHKRQSQIINLIHQRARAAYNNAKDPKTKARLKKAYDYAEKRKEASKRKTKRMNKAKNESIAYRSILQEINDSLEEKKKRKKRKKAGTESGKESSLRDWFGRKGAKGKKKGWVDCNAPDGKGGYKACGRSSGEKRKKYPACRPTPAACKERGRGKSWGKKAKRKSKTKEALDMELNKDLLLNTIKEELKDSIIYFQMVDPSYDDGAIAEEIEFWDDVIEEAEYRGRKVKLNKPMRGDVKKFKVYVKDPKTGNIKKVNFGDKKMRIKKSNPKRRKSFRARHNCDNPGPKTKARYWSCKKW
tara:strand:- start:161 stop:1999 length:1839 start_codon:yes stop_codon:yes gene_type:complete